MRVLLKRPFYLTVAITLLLIAALRFPVVAGQGAVSLSRAGHEDLTFWVNHNGLDQIDVEGEIGFGDMARLLMRRRSNAARMQALRDRFVFKVREFDKLDAPDLLRPGNPPYVIAQNRIFNLLSVRAGKGVAYKVFETQPGTGSGAMVKRTFDGVEAAFDVRPLARLRVKIVDENGKPAAARLYLTAADGLAYAPRGAISRFAALPAEPYFHARGSFEMDLPAGETTIEATRGLEYELVTKQVRLHPQAPTDVTLGLKRWTNMAATNWYSSDAHIHANYTADHHQVVTAQDVQLYAHAEDLHYANMMVANSFGAFLHDTALFSGKPHPLSTRDYVLYWNEEMRNAGLYGHMCLFNLKRLVEPLYTGFAGTPQSDDYPPNFTQAKAARAQGGAVTYAHPGYAPTLDGASARELPVDLALGEVDAMDVLSNNPEEVALDLWYKLLNCGFRLGISAGTDSFTNVADHYTPGGGRVYAHLAGRMNPIDWVRAFRQGRTFATNGPMISLRVQDREPGDEIHLPSGPQRIPVVLKVDSKVPIDKIELIVNGKPFPGITSTITLDRSSWIAVRATGPAHRLVLNDTAAFAHTSPVYVYLGKQPIASPGDAKFFVQWIDGLIQRVGQRGRFSTPERKREVVELFTRARDIYQRKAQE
ncbi:MAG: CehA/McbA family metallohydrolase [Acidobacteriia bacterium]|nr:CehA/McbA family metallohydrolase [Terriglobia bacterium]